MDESVKKGLEGALRAAVEANGSGSANGASVNGLPDDTAGLVNLFIKALPKLLANAEAPDDMSDALARLRKETRMLRREVRELSLKMDVVCDQQAMAITQLARIQLVDPSMHGDLDDDDEVEDDDEIAEEVLEPYRPKRRAAASRNAVERTRNKGRRRKA